MSTLTEHQFELLPTLDASDGQVFGIGADVSIDEGGFHPGATDWATQNVQSGVTGNTVFGRDVLLGPVWAWDAHINRDDCPNAIETLGELTTAWRALHIRDVPGAVIPLRYRIANRVRRIYGRPGKFEASMNNLILSGMTPVTMDFQAVDGFSYSDTESTMVVEIGEAEEGATGGGFVFPVTFPVTSQAPTEQAAQAVVGGDAPTHPRIRVNGPLLAGWRIESDDWVLSVDLDIPDGEYVEIDTRPWAGGGTVLLNGTSSVGGKLGRRQRLTDVVLKPGNLEVRFTGTSSTGTASCQLWWSDAYNGL